MQSLGVETMRLSHGGASAPSDTLSLQVSLAGSFRHSPSISANVVFRPVLSKKRDRVVHKSTFSVACPVASDLSAFLCRVQQKTGHLTTSGLENLALEIELDTGARKAAVFSEIACPGLCKG